MVQEKLIIICGPTCSGKTRLGIKLAQKFNGEIISADSQQVYMELNIGTAKPSDLDRRLVPHHLIDIVSPAEQFDASQFVSLADAAIKDITGRRKRAFVIGGTGLYIKALCYGLADAPPRDEAYRLQLNEIREKDGTPQLWVMLFKKDPRSAGKLKQNDTSRIIRALEVLHTTGRSISEFQQGHGFKEPRYDVLKIGLNVDRAELYRRIDERVDEMIGNGLFDEAKRLVEKYGAGAPALKAVGYNEFNKFNKFSKSPPKADQPLADIKFSELVELIKRNTRRYAKRQMTWFRHEPGLEWFSPEDVDKLEQRIKDFLK